MRLLVPALAFLELVEGTVDGTDRPLLNHLSVLVEEAAPAQELGFEVAAMGAGGSDVIATEQLDDLATEQLDDLARYFGVDSRCLVSDSVC